MKKISPNPGRGRPRRHKECCLVKKWKGKLLALALLATGAACLALGTAAFFSAETTAHNVITTGGVEIELREWADEARETPFEDVTGVLPGAEIVKIAEIENTGASEAWIRVGVTKSIRLAGSGRADLSLVSLDINTADWTLGKDGFYYYNTALKPGEVTAPLFTAVTFADEMGNEYQNAAAAVDVAAQAVQTANNGASALDAAGWPKA